MTFPAGTTLSGATYVVEYSEQAPAGGVPTPSAGPWATVKATNGFTANITVAPGAGVTRNFIARVKI